MRFGAMNNPRNNLLKEIKWMAENDFDFIDLTIEPPEAYNLNTKQIKKALKDYGLAAIGHTNPVLPFAFPIENIRKACFKEFKKYLNDFHKLGIEYVAIHPSRIGQIYSDKEKLELNIEFLKRLAKETAEMGLILILENDTKPFNSVPSFQKILREVPELRILLDVGHANIEQKTNQTKNFFKNFSKKIWHIHVSDNNGKEDDHFALGEGNIRWKEIIRTIKEFNYNKTITIEVFTNKGEIIKSRNKIKEALANESL